MKKIKTCLVLIVFFTGNTALAQDNQLVYFDGGYLSLQFQFSQNLITTASDFQLPENPALVAFHKTPQINIRWVPPVGYDLTRDYNLDRYLNQQVDQIVTRFRKPSSDFQYPGLALKLGINGIVQGLGMIVPVEGTLLSFNYRQILDFKLDLLGQAHEATIQTRVNGEPFWFYSQNDMILNFGLTGQSLQFGIARNLHKSWFWGFHLTGYYVHAFAEGHLNTQGSFYNGAQTYFFNDPAAGWENQFFQHLDAGYQGTGIGAKLGGAFQLNSQWIFDLLVDLIPNFALDGDLNLVQYKFSALNTAVLFENAGGNIIRPDEINELQPTRTYPIGNQIDNSITIRLPSQISFGSTMIRDTWRLHSRLSFYLREFSFHYSDTKAGLKPILGVKLGAVFPWFQLDTGFILVNEIREGLDKHIDVNRPEFKLPLPMLSVGSGFKLGQQYQLGGLVTILPIPAFRLNLTTFL